MADGTYIEPLTWEIVAKVIEKERPDALLPTLGGQTGLNTAMALAKHGVLDTFGVDRIAFLVLKIGHAHLGFQVTQPLRTVPFQIHSQQIGGQVRIPEKVH